MDINQSSYIKLNQDTTIYNDDCMKVLKELPDSSVDLVLTDPPYGTTSIEWDKILNFDDNANKNYALLHCNSTYPAPLEDLNLSAIKTLKEKFFCEVGYSGHEFRLGTSVAAIYLGATIIERHITLDRTMWGTDHLSSVEPQGLIKLVKGIRELETSYGDGELSCTEAELVIAKKLRG